MTEAQERKMVGLSGFSVEDLREQDAVITMLRAVRHLDQDDDEDTTDAMTLLCVLVYRLSDNWDAARALKVSMTFNQIEAGR